MRAGARTRKQPEVRSAEWVDRSPICIRDQEVTVMHIIIVLDEGEADCLRAQYQVNRWRASDLLPVCA